MKHQSQFRPDPCPNEGTNLFSTLVPVLFLARYRPSLSISIKYNHVTELRCVHECQFPSYPSSAPSCRTGYLYSVSLGAIWYVIDVLWPGGSYRESSRSTNSTSRGSRPKCRSANVIGNWNLCGPALPGCGEYSRTVTKINADSKLFRAEISLDARLDASL